MDDNSLYIGTVFHKRHAPKTHILRYKVFNLFADLDKLEQLARNNRFFSLNRFNLISIYEKDYGNPDDPGNIPLKQRVIKLLEENDVDTTQIKKIKILTYPRVLGFSFNPLNIYYCYGENDKNIAIIYEVRNTFSERHNYIYVVPENASFFDKHTATKRFHVSPFFDRKGQYLFSHKKSEKNLSVTIEYTHEGNHRLTASFNGEQHKITEKMLLKLCVMTPFMTLKVIIGILYEALKLWLKGLNVNPHPEDHSYQSSKALQIIHKKNDL